MNYKNEYGVCNECSKVNLQTKCLGCGREPSSTKCGDCGKHIGGGFPFKEEHRSGLRCFECLKINLKKEKAWSGLEQIEESLSSKIEFDGRHWKRYALELKKKLDDVNQITTIYLNDKEEFIK